MKGSPALQIHHLNLLEMSDQNWELLHLFFNSSKGQILPLTQHKSLFMDLVGASGLLSLF